MGSRAQQFDRVIRPHVEGWVSERTPEMVEYISEVQEELGFWGDIAEIGVHRGLFLLLLAGMRQPNEIIRGFDIFDAQELNVSDSGLGSREAVEAAIARFFPDEKERFVLEKVDSMSIRASDRERMFPRPVRLMSVDGGHAYAHVLNDMSLAQEVVCRGGVVILDDFFAPHWPAVTQGFFSFMQSHNLRLAPFLFFLNKLYLTTFSEHELVSAGFRRRLEAATGRELHEGHWKTVEIAGFKTLSFG